MHTCTLNSEKSHCYSFLNLLFRRVQFHLEEGGDLIWIVPPALEQESLPFFSCETFVVSVINDIVIYVLADRKLSTTSVIVLIICYGTHYLFCFR